MIVSVALVVIGAVLLLLASAHDSLPLVGASIAACVAALVVLGFGVAMHQRASASGG